MCHRRLAKELDKTKKSLNESLMNGVAYTFLIEELTKHHPNPKAAFNAIIESYGIFRQLITDLADRLKLDLSVDE